VLSSLTGRAQCIGAWAANNPIAMAQRNLSNDAKNIYLGANTDDLLDQDRLSDQCHFSEKGQLKAANAFSTAIHQHKTL